MTKIEMAIVAGLFALLMAISLTASAEIVLVHGSPVAAATAANSSAAHEPAAQATAAASASHHDDAHHRRAHARKVNHHNLRRNHDSAILSPL